MQWFKKNIWLLLAIVVAILAGRMLLTNKHFYTHDDIQVFRVNEFIECFKKGQIPCRWSENLGKGYGYPWFNYYPPMIYVFPALINLTGLSIITSLNLFMFMTFIVAAWSMYILVKELTQRADVAFLGSILMTLYPFHATNAFSRGVYAENLTWSVTPILLYLLYKQVKSKFHPALPFVFAFIFLTHIISSFVLVGISLYWVITLALEYKKNLTHLLLLLFLQIILGIGMAAFFFVPALMEKGLVQSDSLTKGYFSYTNHYVSFFQLFKEYKWNYDSSLWSAAPDEMPFMVGHMHLILLLITLISPLILRIRPRLVLSCAMFLATAGFLFLAHFKSDPIWSLVPALAYIQFPWRFVVWAGIPLVLTITLLIAILPKRICSTIILFTSIALIIYSYPFFFPRSYDNYTDTDLLTGSEMREQQTKSLYDYLPVTVHQIPEKFATNETNTEVFYFPGWEATKDGQQVEIIPDPVHGLIIPADPTIDGKSLTLTWHETPFRTIMDLISVATLIVYGFYLWKSHVQYPL